MKIYVKLALGIVAFGFLLSVLGAIAIRTQAQQVRNDNSSSVKNVDTTEIKRGVDDASSAVVTKPEPETKKEAAAVQKK